MKINHKTISKASIGILLLGIALTRLDFHKILLSFQGCDYKFLLLAAIVSFTNVFWAMWIRKNILRLLVNVSYGVMLKSFFVSNYIASFTPANIGGLLGEPWGLYSFSQKRVSMGKGLALVVLTIITQNIRRIILTILGLALFAHILPQGYIGVIVLSVLAYTAYSTIILTLLSPRSRLSFIFRFSRAIVSKLSESFSTKLQSFADETEGHFHQLLSRPKHYFLLGVLTASNVFLEGLRLWLLLLAFGVNFNFAYLLLIPSLAYSVTVLPVSLGGLGITELSGMIVLQSFGLPPEVAFPAIFLDRFLFTYWGFCLGGMLLPFMRLPTSMAKT